MEASIRDGRPPAQPTAGESGASTDATRSDVTAVSVKPLEQDECDVSTP